MSYSILVVEDDLNMLELVVEYLEEEGYTARGATGSQEALALAKRFPFDLVITDVRMAGVDGVDGFVLLKKKLPELKCVVITGYTDHDAPERAIKIQIDDYLHKPFKLDELLTVVNRVLNANSLAAYYYNLLERAPARLFAAARRFFKKDANQALDEVRKQTFQGLYVAIRSNLISVNSANGVFSRLLELDREYREHLASPNDHSASVLHSEFDELFSFLTALTRSKAQMLGGERIPATEFRSLYNAVQRGEITPEQLHLAPTLRQVEPTDLEGSPELISLREKLWGAA